MRLEDFDYPLPKELIAQRPTEPRDASRLLVLRRSDGSIEDRVFSDLPRFIPAGDVLVLNDTKVFAARLEGRKKGTGGKAEVLLLSEAGPRAWKCLVRPGIREGQVIEFSEKGAEAVFLKRNAEGLPILEFKGVEDVRRFAESAGSMPLPPYIKRKSGSEDRDTYQTVYAREEGAVAAPTAGLHFTPSLMEDLHRRGVETVFVTLHVGYGTFRPVEDLEAHRMHAEDFVLAAEAADRINRARSLKKNIWAVGTTTLRVLETCVRKKKLVAGSGQTDLYIRAPFKFEAVDRLITNFHLPKTTLLLLVSAFAGEANRKKAYDHAIARKYRFYSYGDAMLII